MDHTLCTTKGVNRRSSHIQINEAVQECIVSIMREYHETGFVCNWKPKTFDEARHIATGLAVEDARKRCGSMVPPFAWDNKYIPEVYQKQHKIPFQFVNDIQFKKLLEADKEKMSWQLLGAKELVERVEAEEAEDVACQARAEAALPGATEDPELAELERILAETEAELPGKKIEVVEPAKSEDDTMSPTEKISQGLKERRYSGPPPPATREVRTETKLEALRAKAPEDLTSAEKIRLGVDEAEPRKGRGAERED